MPQVRDIAERACETPESLSRTEIQHLGFWIATHAEHVRAHQETTQAPVMLREYRPMTGSELVNRIAGQRRGEEPMAAVGTEPVLHGEMPAPQDEAPLA